MIETNGYEFAVQCGVDYATAERRTRELLKDEGFGILTEIDVQATFREKLDLGFRPYKILGACNPQLAHRALVAEAGIGLLLPCNVVLEQHGGHTRVRFMEPTAALALVGNPAVDGVAREASERLHRVADRLRAEQPGAPAGGARP